MNWRQLLMVGAGVMRLANGRGILARAVLQDTLSGVLVLDRDGTVLRGNATLARMLRGELGRGSSGALAFAAADRDAAWSAIQAALSGRVKAPPAFEARLAGPGLTVRVAGHRLRGWRGTSGLLLRFVDMSAQRGLQAELEQTQHLQAVGRLAGGIAHDFNNLLQAITGASEALLEYAPAGTEMRADITQIQDSAVRGAALVRQLLAFGRQQSLQPRSVDVNAALRDVAKMLRRLLGASLHLVLDLETPSRHVLVDPGQLDQVLVNLAVNARDAMLEAGGGGTLTLRSCHATLFERLLKGPEVIPAGRYVMIEVADTGPGIPADVLPSIFEPFFTTRRDRGGTGLGLATVHGILRQSGGYLAVDSQAGAGTRMRIYLPRHEAAPPVLSPEAAPMAQPAAVGPVQLHHGLVLLVEDEAPVRMIAARQLTRRGWTVLDADCAEAALALLDPQAPPRAIVTDMVMPGMDGVALVQQLRQRLGNPSLPAILVSGYAQESLRAGAAATATVFLPKPYRMVDLASALDEVTAASQ